MNPSEEFETAVRILRDRVYETPASDVGWNGCREHWLLPHNVRWLIEMHERTERVHFMMHLNRTHKTFNVRAYQGMLCVVESPT